MKKFDYLNEKTITKFAIEIIAGVRDLHYESIAIKDIKPENILVSYFFACKVSDLGLGE